MGLIVTSIVCNGFENKMLQKITFSAEKKVQKSAQF